MSFGKRYAAKELGVLEYKGTWNASTNLPALVSSVGDKGDYYIVSVAGSTNLNNIVDWQPGDWVVFSGTEWQKLDNSETTEVVNSMSGNEENKAPSVNAISQYINLISVDAKDRSFHTGVQLSETISDFVESVHTATVSLFGESSDINFLYPDENGKVQAVLKPTGVQAGSYNAVTIDDKGRIIAATSNESGVVGKETLFTNTINTTTLTNFIDINGLISSNLLPGLYQFTFKALVNSTSTGTGIGVKLIPKTAAISTVYAKYSITQAVPGTTQSYEYDQISQNTNITSTSAPSAAFGFVIQGEGVVRIVTTGSIAMQFRSEIQDSAVSINQDAILILEKI